jgi:hypothetical protein
MNRAISKKRNHQPKKGHAPSSADIYQFALLHGIQFFHDYPDAHPAGIFVEKVDVPHDRIPHLEELELRVVKRHLGIVEIDRITRETTNPEFSADREIRVVSKGGKLPMGKPQIKALYLKSFRIHLPVLLLRYPDCPAAVDTGDVYSASGNKQRKKNGCHKNCTSVPHADKIAYSVWLRGGLCQLAQLKMDGRCKRLPPTLHHRRHGCTVPCRETIFR